MDRDGSPRPKTDCSSYSRRLFGGKRESLCSEVTTMTTYVANGYNPVSTQTGGPPQQQQSLLQPAPQQPPTATGQHLTYRNSNAGIAPNSGGDPDVKSTVKDSLL
ncbi:uncharacterized protein LOC121879994 [Homarus americanus]|uniref:uncharacterized protein LOC121879994 n=1 Tax=Homarus americanus TaxID=6706 RepID=UPI001C48A6E5|nr:uncharacterized protein LOC121879994 [Homarus americanus]